MPEKVATTCTEDGHRQTTKTSTTIWTKRTKEHRKTEEEMEGPTLQEHDVAFTTLRERGRKQFDRHIFMTKSKTLLVISPETV